MDVTKLKNLLFDRFIISNVSENEMVPVMEKLEEMQYFDCPASSKYHGGFPGGLIEHCTGVTDYLLQFTYENKLKWQRKCSPLIVGYFHDLCKCDSYSLTSSGYQYNEDRLLQGHGEVSVMIASTLFKLTEEEVLCIRYHMGAYAKQDWKGFDLAIKKYPNVLWTHHADMMASKVGGV